MDCSNWNETLTLLNYRLPVLYRTEPQAIAIIEKAKYNTIQIDTSGGPVQMWFNILDYARKTGNGCSKVISLMEVVTSAKELGADDETLIGILENLKNGQAPVESPKPNSPTPNRKDEEAGLEKLMGPKSTLMPISFLEEGLLRARAVIRIVTPEGIGSGFMIANGLVVTNNHVIGSKEIARQSRVQFNFQKTLSGLDEPFEEFALDPDVFFVTSGQRIETRSYDYTIVKVKGDVSKFGELSFAATMVSKNDFVNIIQHPAGGPKQIALYNNVVTGVNDDVIQYLTDTLPGSSGSPVFNSSWEVVALHHAGGNLVDPESKSIVFRNEGIPIRRILEAIS
jgi:V8-like Glu-specific endopeptidase